MVAVIDLKVEGTFQVTQTKGVGRGAKGVGH